MLGPVPIPPVRSRLGGVNPRHRRPRTFRGRLCRPPAATFLLDTLLNRDRTLTALEIETNAVRIPDWYRPNPGRAGELAFIFFSGPDDDPRPIRGRFGLSAYGTATSATLNNSDTVPPSARSTTLGLLAGIGGARGWQSLAMAKDLDDDVSGRAAGVTIVCRWAQLRLLVNAARNLPERNSVRVRRSVCPRPVARVGPVRPGRRSRLLVHQRGRPNVNPAKPGSLGRLLSQRLPIVRWDPLKRSNLFRRRRLRHPVRRRRTGLLLVKISSGHHRVGAPRRNLFEAGDAWFSSGSLNADGDYWLIDSVDTQIRPTARWCPAIPRPSARPPSTWCAGVASDDAGSGGRGTSLVDGNLRRRPGRGRSRARRATAGVRPRRRRGADARGAARRRSAGVRCPVCTGQTRQLQGRNCDRWSRCCSAVSCAAVRRTAPCAVRPVNVGPACRAVPWRRVLIVSHPPASLDLPGPPVRARPRSGHYFNVVG